MDNNTKRGGVPRLVERLLIASIAISVLILGIGLLAGEQFDPAAWFFMLLWLAWAIVMWVRLRSA